MPTTAPDHGCLGLKVAQRGADLPLVLVASAALIDADGRVLVQQRPEEKSWPGWWEFPGGKLHAGETPEATVVRELREDRHVVRVPAAQHGARLDLLLVLDEHFGAGRDRVAVDLAIANHSHPAWQTCGSPPSVQPAGPEPYHPVAS